MSVASIVETAFSSAQKSFPDVIKACSIDRVSESGEYVVETGKFTESTTIIKGRSLVATGSPTKDLFGDYTIGPKEELIYLQGLSEPPIEGDRLTIGTKVRTIKVVGDIVGAGTFFAVMAV